MPTNLNALIRYKQIDRELSNPYLKTTIKSLQEACSKQLAEHRGVYKLISERTIRDDIRVMRSEALGFNAPIIVEGGIYSYSDLEYSIFNSKIEELEIMKEVLYLLIEEKDKIHNVKLTKVMEALSLLTGIELEEEKPISMNIKFSNKLEISKRSISNNKMTLDLSFEENVYFNLMPEIEQPKYNWKSIFELI